MKLRPIKLLAVCLTVPAMFFLHARHLKLWFDETVQLSSAHSSHPEKLDPYRYAVDPATAIAYNQNYNMDPGGYTLFLNLMSPVVQNRFHLYRIINIAAFITGLALIVRRLTQWQGRSVPWVDAVLWSAGYLLFATFIIQLPPKDNPFPSIMKWLPFTSLLKSGFSIRAYGFEFLAVSLLLYGMDWHRTLSPVRYLAVAVVILIGLSLRYEFAFIASAFLAAVAYDAFRSGGLKRTLAFPFSWVVLASALLGVFLAYRFGYTFHMGAGEAPMKMRYLSHSYLNSQRNIMLALKDWRNVLALGLFLFTAWRVLTSRHSSIELLYILLFTVYLALSLKGYHPFGMGIDRCLSIVTVLNVAILHLSFSCMARLWAAGVGSAGLLKASIRRFATTSTALVAGCSCWVLATAFRKHGEEPFVSAMTSGHTLCFDKTMSRVEGATVFLDRAATPDVKAFYQFRGRPLPENRYVTETVGPHSRQFGKQVRSLEERCAFLEGNLFDYYLIPELVDKSDSLRMKMSGPGFASVSCVPSLKPRPRRPSLIFGSSSAFYRRK